MRALGLIPSDDEVKVGVEYLECYIENVQMFQELFQRMDKDGSGAIEFDEFIHVLDHPMICLTKDQIKEDIESCFR